MEGVYDFLNPLMMVVLALLVAATIHLCIGRRSQKGQEVSNQDSYSIRKGSDGRTSGMSTSEQSMKAAVEEPRRKHKNLEKCLTVKDTGVIVDVLWDAKTKWYFIGLKLCVNTAELDNIRIENSDVGMCLTKVISYWLRNSPNPSWSRLCNALEQPTVGHRDLSKSIRSRYISASSSSFNEDGCDTEHDIPSPTKSSLHTAFRCPCGKNCSYDDYLQMKCQDCNDSTMFPYLDVRDLDDEDRIRFVRKLRKDTYNVMETFSSLYLDVLKSLESRNISPTSVARSLSWSVDPHDPSSEQVNESDIITDSIDSVFKSKSVEGSINFFNYHRLHKVVEQHGTDADQDRFQQYLTAFQTFCKRSAFEVPVNVFGEAPRNSKKFAIKIIEPPKESSSKWLTLNDVQRFQHMLADKLGIDSALYLHTVNKGCVQLQFWVPIHVANQNMDLTKYPTQLQIGEYNTQLLPGPPTKLRVEKNSKNDVTLQWCKPEYGSHNIQRYQILYKSKQLKTWKISETSGDTESITIHVTNLSSQGSLFTFKIHACSDVGEGVDCEEVEIDLQDDILHSHDGDMDDPPPRQKDLPLPNVPHGAMADRGVDMDRPPPTEEGHCEHKDVEKWLTEKDFRQIYRALWSAKNKWYFIGFELGIETSELDTIKAENIDVGTCLTKVIWYWLRNYPNLSWSTLCNALEQPTVGYSELSRSIRLRYISASDLNHNRSNTEDDIPSPVKSSLPTAFKCPCGKNCSYNDYLQMKCQDCNDSTMFPYLDVRDLDDEDRKRLTHKLRKDTCNIMRMFDSLYLDSVDSLESENINPVTVARCISCSTDPHVPDSEQVNASDIITDSIDSVFKSKSVEGSINFFNYHRLHNVVEQHGTDEDKDKFKQYLKAFQTFCKRSVFEVPVNVFGEAPPDSKRFAIKIFEAPKESSSTNKWLTLNDVKHFQQMLADKLGIDISTLSLHTVNKGCVQLQFGVPIHVANQNMDLTKYPTQFQVGEYITHSSYLDHRLN